MVKRFELPFFYYRYLTPWKSSSRAVDKREGVKEIQQQLTGVIFEIRV
jgi:hypothetical protein